MNGSLVGPIGCPCSRSCRPSLSSPPPWLAPRAPSLESTRPPSEDLPPAPPAFNLHDVLRHSSCSGTWRPRPESSGRCVPPRQQGRESTFSWTDVASTATGIGADEGLGVAAEVLGKLGEDDVVGVGGAAEVAGLKGLAQQRASAMA